MKISMKFVQKHLKCEENYGIIIETSYHKKMKHNKEDFMMNWKKAAAFLLTIAAAAGTMAMPVSAVQFVGGDMDGDDDVDAADAALILQYAAYRGAGGTKSIYDYLAPPQETVQETYVLNEMAGKTLAELEDIGFEVSGFWRISDILFVYAKHDDYTDKNLDAFVKSLEGKTVSDMVEEYDFLISYSSLDGIYTLYSTLDFMDLYFDLEHGQETLTKHKDDFFFAPEEAPELQNDVLENIRYSNVTFKIELDDASRAKLFAVDSLSESYIESIADELVASKVYYTIE